jgi:oligoendopeptidase F
MHTTLLPNQRLTRTFLPVDFSVTTWEALEPWYRQLLDAQPSGVDELKAWLHRRSELESVVGEDLAWRYIRMNADTADVSRAEAFQHFIENIEPHLAPVNHALNQKLVAHPAADALQDSGHRIYLRNVRNAIELFREANIPLMVELSTLQQEYGRICSAMTIEHEGKELTLQQAARLLEEPDRDLRKRKTAMHWMPCSISSLPCAKKWPATPVLPTSAITCTKSSVVLTTPLKTAKPFTER